MSAGVVPTVRKKMAILRQHNERGGLSMAQDYRPRHLDESRRGLALLRTHVGCHLRSSAARRLPVLPPAVAQFRQHYSDPSLTKEQVFHYLYALLHHPDYRERYAANLKRELPRIPFAPDFTAFANRSEERR